MYKHIGFMLLSALATVPTVAAALPLHITVTATVVIVTISHILTKRVRIMTKRKQHPPYHVSN